MLALITLRRWLLAGADTISLRPQEAAELALSPQASRRRHEPSRPGRMLRAFIKARALAWSAAPEGRLRPLHNAWPGMRSLVGPREWVAEQDVSSRALRQARYELPAAQKEALDVNFARHRRLLSDLRMAPGLYLRGYPEQRYGVSFTGAVGPVVVAAEYVRQGRADVLERDLLCTLRLDDDSFLAWALLLALRELDPQRAYAVARRLFASLKEDVNSHRNDMMQLVLADDPSAEPLLRRRSELPRSLGAHAALLARAGDAAGAALEACIQRGEFVGSYLEDVVDSLCEQPRWRAATTSMEETVLRKLAASTTTSGLGEDSAARRYGPKNWVALLSVFPPSEENAAAIARHRAEDDYIGEAEVSVYPRALLRSLLLERGLDGWDSRTALERLSPAEVFDIFSDGIAENEDLQDLMLEFIEPPMEGEALYLGLELESQLRPLEWDRRWLQLGLDRGLPRVVAGVLRREDRAAARMVIESFASLEGDDQVDVIGRFARLNLPERLDAIVAALRSPAGNRHMSVGLEDWIRPWSDGPALERLLVELKGLPKSKRLSDYDSVIEMLEQMSEGYIRMDVRSWMI